MTVLLGPGSAPLLNVRMSIRKALNMIHAISYPGGKMQMMIIIVSKNETNKTKVSFKNLKATKIKPIVKSNKLMLNRINV